MMKRPRIRNLLTYVHPLALLRNFHLLIIGDNILKRKVTLNDTGRNQIVVPRGLNQVVLKNDFGHQEGRDHVTSLVRNIFSWNGMNCDIDRWMNNSHTYLRRKAQTNKQAPLMPFQTSYPLNWYAWTPDT